MPLLFSSTLFVSAALLFWIQLIIAKMILPWFGGTPSVWNTCMVFFQLELLAGYTYAHVLARKLSTLGQLPIHLAVLSLPLALLMLPVEVPASWVPPADVSPVPWLFGLLATVVGPPFFVIGSSAPLLQKWFAGTSHARAGDPYFLYAASNAGSMLALLSYPVLVEPLLPLRHQALLWSAGYGLLVVLMLACGVAVWRSPARVAAPLRRTPAGTIDSRMVWRWLALSFVPSSLMLGVTMHLTLDIAAVPLLWIIPLALYLLSFILVFSKLPMWFHPAMTWALPVLVIVQLFVGLSVGLISAWAQLLLHLVTFFVAALACHGELARLRPGPEQLTQFYLVMSLGGVLGGVCNALVAPLLLTMVLEYPFALIAACMLMPPRKQANDPALNVWDVVLPAALAGVLLVWLVFKDMPRAPTRAELRDAPPEPVAAVAWRTAIVFAVCLGFIRRPVRLALGAAALLLTNIAYNSTVSPNIYRERNFFGVLRVSEQLNGTVHRFYHGNTEHGAQRLVADADVRGLPLLYYDPTGPIGQVFVSLLEHEKRPPVAVIGLGVGALAAYGESGQEFTFFEIDPGVKKIAEDPRLFTYLHECRARLRVVLGDARLTLAHEPDECFGLVVVDAFSSDSIPMHLITREALQLYLTKTAPSGVIALHISNNYLNLEPIIARLAAAEGLAAFTQLERSNDLSDAERRRGKLPSHWVLLARKPAHVAFLGPNRRWKPLRANPATPLWTDDFSNLLSALRWN